MKRREARAQIEEWERKSFRGRVGRPGLTPL
jgi:hypothetical protein